GESRRGGVKRAPGARGQAPPQEKTDLVTSVVSPLQEFSGEKLAALLKHQAGPRLVSQYDQNNTYQYIINREEAQLSWVGKAIAELGAIVPDDQAEPARGGGRGADGSRAIFDEDARDAQAFVDRWRPRL